MESRKSTRSFPCVPRPWTRARTVRTIRQNDPCADDRQPGPRDLATRRARLLRTGVGAADAARRLRHRRPSGHPAASRARRGGDGAADDRRDLHLSGIWHHLGGGPDDGRRRPPRRTRPGCGRDVARAAARRRTRRGRTGLRAADRQRFRPVAAGRVVRRHLPADRVPRDPVDVAAARRNRGATRDAGHENPAGRRGDRQPGEHRAQRRARLRAAAGHRRIRARHDARPDRGRRRARRGGGARRPARRRLAAPGPRRHRRLRPGRRAAGGPYAHAARGSGADHLRRHRARHHRARRAPGRVHALAVPRPGAGRDRDRRPGAHRPLPGRPPTSTAPAPRPAG